MSDPSLALQRAIRDALKADSALTALVGGRVYDRPPANPVMPYVTFGADQTLPDRGDGYEGSDVTLTLHAWDVEPGFVGVKRIAAAIRAALGPDLALAAGTRLVDLVFDETRTMRDPDGITSHAVVTFTALTEPE